MRNPDRPIHGRGTAHNPSNRFEPLSYEPDPESADADGPAPRTEFFEDTSRTIIAYNDSPDIGFDASVNPYRGCEHGCIYCYARPYHEYLGFSAGLDFETKILVKTAAPDLLSRELASPRWKPQVIAMSGVTDPYQPIERKLRLTRRCLEVLAEFRNPVLVVTKNHLVTRDTDVLASLSQDGAAAVYVTITTLDRRLAGRMEPRTSEPGRRLEAIRSLVDAGVPAGAFIAPVVPGLTDHELPKIVEAAVDAGARFAISVPLRLPRGVSGLFASWLDDHAPGRKNKVLNRIRSMRAGRLDDSRFGTRMKGSGEYAKQIRQMFHTACKRSGIDAGGPELSTSAFRCPGDRQMSLFE